MFTVHTITDFSLSTAGARVFPQQLETKERKHRIVRAATASRPFLLKLGQSGAHSAAALQAVCNETPVTCQHLIPAHGQIGRRRKSGLFEKEKLFSLMYCEPYMHEVYQIVLRASNAASIHTESPAIHDSMLTKTEGTSVQSVESH